MLSVLRITIGAMAVPAAAAAMTATLTFTAPSGWVARAPASSMRVADFSLPAVPGDAEDASVTVFFFGATQGGSVQANIDRWVGQMAQPDGRPSSATAVKSKSTTASGLPLTIVDVQGTYVAEVTPGSAERFNKPGFRQIAVYIDTPGGPYFVKCVGPAATVAKWHDSLQAFLRSVKYQ